MSKGKKNALSGSALPLMQLPADDRMGGRSSSRENHQNLPMSPSEQTALYFQMMHIDNQPFNEMQNERSYLLQSLERQRGRAQNLRRGLLDAERRLDSALGKGETRRLRSEARLLKIKIAESANQERLILLRLGDLYRGGVTPRGLSPIHQPRVQVQSLGWGHDAQQQSWTQTVWTPISPLTLVSPPSHLASGSFYPRPTAPSYWESHFPCWQPGLQSESAVVAEAADHEECAEKGAEDALPDSEGWPARGASREYAQPDETVEETGRAGEGRRWSVADPCNPSPRGKRLSMPSLQSTWQG